MEQVSFSYPFYNCQLLCQFISDRIQFRLEPIDLSNRSLNHYLYSCEYSDMNLPFQLKFMFNDTAQEWFRYICFYKQKCFNINASLIDKDMESYNLGEIQYVELPIMFGIIKPEGMKSSKISLCGSKELFSKQRKLQKMIESKQMKICELNDRLFEKNVKIQQLQKILGQIQQKYSQLQENYDRLLQNQLPRKKIHSEEIISKEISFSNQIEIQTSHQRKNNHHRPIQQVQYKNLNLSTNQIHNKSLNGSRVSQSSIQNHPSKSAQLHKNQTNSITEQIINFNQILPAYQVQHHENHSENFCNRSVQMEQTYQKPSGLQTEHRNTFSMKLVNQNRVHQEDQPIEPVASTQDTSKLDQQKRPKPQQSSSESNEKPLPKTTDEKQSSLSINSALGSSSHSLSEQTYKMLKQFISKEYYLQVGCDDKGNKRFGYCCTFCEKIFKEGQFLFKHLQTRHSDEINNSTTFDYLMGFLNNYKKRREQKRMAIEANLASQRRTSKLDQAINRLTMK